MRTVFEVMCLKSTGGGVSEDTEVGERQTWPHKKEEDVRGLDSAVIVVVGRMDGRSGPSS